MKIIWWTHRNLFMAVHFHSNIINWFFDYHHFMSLGKKSKCVQKNKKTFFLTFRNRKGFVENVIGNSDSGSFKIRISFLKLAPLGSWLLGSLCTNDVEIRVAWNPDSSTRIQSLIILCWQQRSHVRKCQPKNVNINHWVQNQAAGGKTDCSIDWLHG